MCTASQGQGQLKEMMAHGSLDAAWDDRQLTALRYWMRWQRITTAARGGCSSIANWQKKKSNFFPVQNL